jgi:hypothetical protein
LDRSGSSPPDPSSVIEYRVIESWRIPNGGYGRVLLIDSTHRNAVALHSLGEQLRRETAADRNAFIEVFDNPRAATLRDEALNENLSKRELAFHDRHKIAFYTKNGNTGFHEYRFTLVGVMSDKWTVIKY